MGKVIFYGDQSTLNLCDLGRIGISIKPSIESDLFVTKELSDIEATPFMSTLLVIKRWFL